MIKSILLFLFFLYMFYVLSGYLVRVVARLTGQRTVNHTRTHTYQRTSTHRGPQRPPQNHTPEGEIRIDYIPEESRPKRKEDAFRGGDYVDYEEIK